MAITPEDILSSNESFLNKDGMQLRKGTIAAAPANADIIESATATEAEKAEARNTIKELAPSLVGVGLQKHMTWKNPEIQQLVEDATRK